jgi:AhpD family alkylhydroperoxidase
MPHVSPLPDAAVAEAVRPLFQAMQARLGVVPNIWRSMAHAPAVLKASLDFYQAIHRDLDPKLRELAYLRTVQLLHCGYCVHYHTPLARKAGLGDAQIEDLERFEQSGAYSELEKNVLRFAEQWTRQGKVDSALMEKLAESLSPGQFVTLAAVVAQANWTARFNESFGVELP